MPINWATIAWKAAFAAPKFALCEISWMLQHVTLEVAPERVEACVAFYALLGFERVQPPPSLAERAAWVQRSGTQVHLMRVEEPVTLPRGHVAVVVEGYEATVGRLHAAGHDVEPRTEHWGSPRAYVRDPGGNLVELMAWPPG
jgi:catechol 2,3-dioxygenase-like lactoylglutathione lyase family enzyme